MPDLSQVFYHGIREQVKRVVGLLGEERTEKGLRAFTKGASTWSHCFFAQALAPEYQLQSENDVARILGLVNGDGRLNLVPVRIVYHTFDRMSSMISKLELADMMRELLDEYRAESAAPVEVEIPNTSETVKEAEKHLAGAPKILDVIKKINYAGVEKTPVNLGGPSCA